VLDQLAAQGDLSQPLDDLLRSYVHMHCNRLLPRDRAAERQVLGLAARTRDSLDRAPAQARTRIEAGVG
jgi:hypothetical protein